MKSHTLVGICLPFFSFNDSWYPENISLLSNSNFSEFYSHQRALRSLTAAGARFKDQRGKDYVLTTEVQNSQDGKKFYSVLDVLVFVFGAHTH